MKIFVFSDTHGYHNMLQIPPDTDLIICCGDVTNYKDKTRNDIEFQSFYNLWKELPQDKIMIAGNHDNCLLRKYNKDKLKECSVYLEHEYYEYKGLTIFGSPYTPTFGDWDFMMSPNKLNRVWEELSTGIDILVTHGPPKGILDLSKNRLGNLEYCGDKTLLNHVLGTNPKHHVFGHIHNGNGYTNYGTRTIKELGTIFYNCSMVKDGDFKSGLINPGQTIII